MRQVGQAFPAGCKCSEQQKGNCSSDMRVLKSLVVALVAVAAQRGTVKHSSARSESKKAGTRLGRLIYTDQKCLVLNNSRDILYNYCRQTQALDTSRTYIADICAPVWCSHGRVRDVLVAGFHCSVSAGLLQEEPGSFLQLLLTRQHLLKAKKRRV